MPYRAGVQVYFPMSDGNKEATSGLPFTNVPVAPSLLSTLYRLTTCGDPGLALRDFIARAADNGRPTGNRLPLPVVCRRWPARTKDKGSIVYLQEGEGRDCVRLRLTRKDKPSVSVDAVS